MSPIHDFTMMKDGSDYKEELLVEPKLLLFVTYDLTIAGRGWYGKTGKIKPGSQRIHSNWNDELC
jgi:hypothetical protein